MNDDELNGGMAWLGLAWEGGRNQWMGEMNHWVGMWDSGIAGTEYGICRYVHTWIFIYTTKGRIAKMNMRMRRKNAPVSRLKMAMATILGRRSIGPPVKWPNGQLAENLPKRGKTNLIKFFLLGPFPALN
jgi:hypothetical protein